MAPWIKPVDRLVRHWQILFDISLQIGADFAQQRIANPLADGEFLEVGQAVLLRYHYIGQSFNEHVQLLGLRKPTISNEIRMNEI